MLLQPSGKEAESGEKFLASAPKQVSGQMAQNLFASNAAQLQTNASNLHLVSGFGFWQCMQIRPV